MSERYIKAEIVRPKRDSATIWGELVGHIAGFAFRVLIVWWFVAAWFPEYGITYWQAILAVYAVRMLVTPVQLPLGRQLK